MVIPAQVVGEDREMQEAMSAQDCFHQEVDAVTDNGEGDSLFGASLGQRKKALVDWKVRGKFDEGVPVRLDEFDLARETFLTRDFALYPSGFPISPGRQSEGFQYGIGGIEGGDGTVEVAVDLRWYGLGKASCSDMALRLVMNHGNPFVTDQLGRSVP